MRNCNEPNVDPKPVVVHEVNELTQEMLMYKIKAGGVNNTLLDFLKNNCRVLVGTLAGRYAIYETIVEKSEEVKESSKLLDENRHLIEAHIQALMKSYDEDGYYFTLLYLNEKLEEIDGQHRFESAMRKNVPVRFMIQPGWGIKEVTVLNVNSKVWTTKDFMESYANQGNINYIRFREFFNNHEFDITTCQMIVLGERSHNRTADDKFRAGEMLVDEGHITSAILKAKKIMEMKRFHPFAWKSRNCVEAILILLNTLDYDHAFMITKMEKFPIISLSRAKSLRVEEYIQLFVELYNRNRQKGKIEITQRFR